MGLGPQLTLEQDGEYFREGSSLPLGEDGERKSCSVTARNASMLASFMSGLMQATVI